MLDRVRKSKLDVRWMILSDMPEVLEIEHGSYVNGWTEEEFLRCLRVRNCIGMVAEQDERVVGFMLYELQKKSLAILNFAVHSHYRRRGVGTRLIGKLVSKLCMDRRKLITVDIRETNLTAQLFLRDCGFFAMSSVTGMYDDTGEDGYCFEYLLEG